MIRLRFALVAGLLLVAGTAHAQFPSNYAGAQVLKVNEHLFGAYVPITQNSLGALVQLRQSFFPGVDFGVQGGLGRLDRGAGSKALVRLGTDVKFALAPPSDEHPYDFALGAALGVFIGEDYSVLAVGPNFVVSRSWNKGLAGEFTPYAGAGLSIATINVGPLNENDFRVPVRVGAEVGITSASRLAFEFSHRFGSKFGDDTEFTLGANLPF